MIREKRNREKLISYYNKFMDEGIVDLNVHPWIAASWQRCAQAQLQHDVFMTRHRLNKEEIAQQLKKHEVVLKYVEGLYEQTKQDLNMHSLSMLLVDNEGYVVKNYSMPFFQRSIEDIQGMRVLEEDVGTSSLSIAMEHNVPFLMFGPEMWSCDCHGGDACSAPIVVNGQLRYVLTFFSMDTVNIPYGLLFNHLLTMKYAIEQHLTMLERWTVNELLMTNFPAAVFWLDRNGEIKYLNGRAEKRMDGHKRLQDVFLNYEHIPVKAALDGTACLRKELAWITAERTYEDITSVLPIRVGIETTGALVISMAIEDLKTMVAHATGYSSRYSLYSMVGQSEAFVQLQHRAQKIARFEYNILIQGEPGTGKQRLAHGIHQASKRAASPLIALKCYTGNDQDLAEEFFGRNGGSRSVAGKLELAQGGTLFLDEVEKLSVEMGDRLAAVLKDRSVYNVRLIAACDSNLKRLTDKKLFSRDLFVLLTQCTIKVPTLRDRTEDIQVIAEHILAEMSAQHNLPQKHLAPETVELLNRCEWLGNIKQLQGVIEKAFFHTPSEVIGPDDVRLPGNKALEKSWKYDKDAFVTAWKTAGGNISKLANLLGVSRVTLYRYLRKYDLR